MALRVVAEQSDDGLAALRRMPDLGARLAAGRPAGPPERVQFWEASYKMMLLLVCGSPAYDVGVVQKARAKSLGGFECMHCSHCFANTDGRLKTCARCHNARYCSPECQAEHWKDAHKDGCVPRSTGRPKCDTAAHADAPL